MRPETLVLVAGIVGGVLALALLTWALFTDRPRGRRRCPRCWYDLTRVPGLRCSECGWRGRRERQVLRTRRRWRWAFVATLIGSVSIGGVVWRAARVRGWPAIAPNTVLIVMLPRLADPEPAFDELCRRIGAEPYYLPVKTRPPELDDALWRWQWIILGDSLEQMASDPTRPVLDRAICFQRLGLLPDDLFMRALERCEHAPGLGRLRAAATRQLVTYRRRFGPDEVAAATGPPSAPPPR